MTNPLIFEVEVSPASVAVELEPSHVDVIRDADPRVIVVATPRPAGDSRYRGQLDHQREDGR